MKRILILFATAILFSCASGSKKMESELNKAYIGMTIQEFNSVFKKKKTIKMDSESTVYMIKKQNWYDSDGSGSDYRYFYFVNNKLVQIDKGERGVDVRVQYDINHK